MRGGVEIWGGADAGARWRRRRGRRAELERERGGLGEESGEL